ncbi:hypothetical protein FJ432_30090 [Mesorhizobium sp. B2-6-5]|nr:hypothetical protein FJ432_30090 [Mesorhizobium sp. B2-6-5]
MVPAKAETVTESCAAIGGLARTVMTKRQSGADMSEMISAIETISQKDFIPMAKGIVIAAYDIPRWNGEELKQQSIADFSNDIQVKCYQRAGQ